MGKRVNEEREKRIYARQQQMALEDAEAEIERLREAGSTALAYLEGCEGLAVSVPIGMLRAALAASPADYGCEWFEDDPDYGDWGTSCGKTWRFIEDGPTENGVKYCVGCGKRVVVAPTNTPTGEDGEDE